jgi:DNA-binding GntR family transcriptional regulator
MIGAMSGLKVQSIVSLGEKTSVSAARIVREAILSGDLAPGETLGEESLGRQLGISRTPVREALVILRSEGLVETPPNRPAAVREFTARDLHEMHSLRAVLEGYGARTAAPLHTDRQIEDLEASVERYARLCEQDDRLPELVDENFRFHGLIMAGANSERLSSMLRQVTAVPLIYKSYMTYSIENRQSALQDHRKILSALKDRDAERSESLMKAHVLWARDLALAHLKLLEQNG